MCRDSVVVDEQAPSVFRTLMSMFDPPCPSMTDVSRLWRGIVNLSLMQNSMQQKIKNLLISLVCWVLDEVVAFFFSAGDMVSMHMASHKVGSISDISVSMVVSENSKVLFLWRDRNELI
jgi:hypothetical protein